MSPTIVAVPAKQPIQCAGRGGAGGGKTSATGSPRRVTKIGFLVLRTRSRTVKQVALNADISIVSIQRAYPGQLL